MSFIEFNKSELVNLRYSLGKELIRTNSSGTYASSTLLNCHTRKYHGLLVAYQPQLDNDLHVLLSSLDETIVQREAEFHLGIHKYPGGVYMPKGHKYLIDFSADPVPRWTYRVGGVKLSKEVILLNDSDSILIKYTLEEAHSPTKLKLQPFLAFRNRHHLSKANIYVNKKFKNVPNGISLRMYKGYSRLYLQTSRTPDYTHFPDWYYNIEYSEEQERGYDYQEDLFVPGIFEFPIRKGEEILFSASLEEMNPRNLKGLFRKETEKRTPRSSFDNCLSNAAKQFIIRRKNKTEIVAGYHWFGTWGRDTFIALPGLTLVQADSKTFREVVDTMLTQLQNGLFPNMGSSYNSVDAPLWFFWALQQYCLSTDSGLSTWKKYGTRMKAILEAYRDGTDFGIRMNEEALIEAGDAGTALTWMDAVVDGKPVTSRHGMPVEINALWFNAVCFSLELAGEAKDKKFLDAWQDIPERIQSSFLRNFWDEKRGYLADVVNGSEKDWAVRPNQIFAASLPHSMLQEDIRARVIDRVRKELLTPRGLSTLSPNDSRYRGVCAGDQRTRDLAYHQGTAWPWLVGHYAEAYLRIHGKKGLPHIEKIYEDFAPTMMEHGISTISEIYDGDPPHTPRGAISQAWSVAEIRRMKYLIERYRRSRS